MYRVIIKNNSIKGMLPVVFLTIFLYVLLVVEIYRNWPFL